MLESTAYRIAPRKMANLREDVCLGKSERENLPVSMANFVENHTNQRAGSGISRWDKYRLNSDTKFAVKHICATDASGTNPRGPALGRVVWVCYWSTWFPFACVLQTVLTFVLPQKKLVTAMQGRGDTETCLALVFEV